MKVWLRFQQILTEGDLVIQNYNVGCHKPVREREREKANVGEPSLSHLDETEKDRIAGSHGWIRIHQRIYKGSKQDL